MNLQQRIQHIKQQQNNLKNLINTQFFITEEEINNIIKNNL